MAGTLGTHSGSTPQTPLHSPSFQSHLHKSHSSLMPNVFEPKHRHHKTLKKLTTPLKKNKEKKKTEQVSVRTSSWPPMAYGSCSRWGPVAKPVELASMVEEEGKKRRRRKKKKCLWEGEWRDHSFLCMQWDERDGYGFFTYLWVEGSKGLSRRDVIKMDGLFGSPPAQALPLLSSFSIIA